MSVSNLVKASEKKENVVKDKTSQNLDRNMGEVS